MSNVRFIIEDDIVSVEFGRRVFSPDEFINYIKNYMSIYRVEDDSISGVVRDFQRRANNGQC